MNGQDVSAGWVAGCVSFVSFRRLGGTTPRKGRPAHVSETLREFTGVVVRHLRTDGRGG